MILLKIFDVKEMMAHLLLRESFDTFLLEEANITKIAKMEIKGRRNREWFDWEEGMPELPGHLYWKEAKPFCYNYIKGKKTPAIFTISLKLTEKEAQVYAIDASLAKAMKEQQTDVLLHFRYEKDELSVITGTSAYTFTMDRRVEFAWDSAVKDIMKKLGIGYEF